MNNKHFKSYQFPLELFSFQRKKLNLNEWKILHAFYYLKGREQKLGSDVFEISLRMLESDFRLQKVFSRNLTRSTFAEFIPEKPLPGEKLLYHTSLPENTRSFLIPESYIAPPFPWIERWKRKKSHIHRRLSNLQSCRLFTALLALQNPTENNEAMSIIDGTALFSLIGFSLGRRAFCDYLNFLKTEGILEYFDVRGVQIKVNWTLEDYSNATQFPLHYQLFPPEEFSTTGKYLHKALINVLNQCSTMADPEGAFSQFPFAEFLWILQHFNPGMARAIKKSSCRIDDLLKNTLQMSARELS